MPRQPDIADHLRAQGLQPVEVAGWRTRGSTTFNPRGSVNHHTAGPARGNHPSLGVLIGGRNDLPGPLCNVSLARDGTVYLIAAGRANHAGAGSWGALSGNSSVWGLEVEHTGVHATEPAPSPAQWDRMHRIHAAFARCSGFVAANVCQHSEWTTRKIDFVSAPRNEFRKRVQHYIANEQQEPRDMPSHVMIWTAGDNGDVASWVTDFVTRMPIATKTHADMLVFFGVTDVVRHDTDAGRFLGLKPGEWVPHNLTAAQLAAIPIENPNPTLASPPSGTGLTSAQVTAAVREALRGLTLKAT